jgi:hypothetical protein
MKKEKYFACPGSAAQVEHEAANRAEDAEWRSLTLREKTIVLLRVAWIIFKISAFLVGCYVIYRLFF